MKCPQREYENPADHQFCGKCGNKLVETLDTANAIPSIEDERQHVITVNAWQAVKLSNLTALKSCSGC